MELYKIEKESDGYYTYEKGRYNQWWPIYMTITLWGAKHKLKKHILEKEKSKASILIGTYDEKGNEIDE